jgi:hypothetical protein
MIEWERLSEACKRMADAMRVFFSASKGMVEVLCSYTVKTAVAYATAGKEHPEWVHRAKYSKKRRTRKKYNDKIIREYCKYSDNV